MLAKKAATQNGFRYVTYRVRLSREMERGMYDLHRRRSTRTDRTGFVVPSQNEWINSSANPFGIDATTYAKAYAGSVSTVGQAKTTSPWGTLDQAGNVVEWTDTITAPPGGGHGARVWRRLHGGISNAPAYQLWLSAVGLQPQSNPFYNETYPWQGFRVGVIGKLHASRR